MGPRPAGCEARPRAEADAGSRIPCSYKKVPPFRVCVRGNQKQQVFHVPRTLAGGKLDHRLCRQRLNAAIKRHIQYSIKKLFRKGTAAHSFVQQPLFIFLNVNLHKTPPGSLAADSAENSNEIFKNHFECGIIFVKYATKTERMLRAAEMREKPI